MKFYLRWYFYYIRVTVVDELGAASSISVQLIACTTCNNNGECVYNENLLDLFIQGICNCNNGWGGDECSDDVDACMEQPCQSATCTDLTPEEEAEQGLGYRCTGCPDGFEGTECLGDLTLFNSFIYLLV